MRSIGISNKILLSLSILVLGYSLTITYGFLMGVKIKQNLNALSSHIFPASQLSQKALDLFEKEIEIYKEMLMTGDYQLISKARENNVELITTLDALIKTVPEASFKRRISDTLINIKDFGGKAPGMYEKMGQPTSEYRPDILKKASHLASQRNMIYNSLLTYRDHFVNTMNFELVFTGDRLQNQGKMNILIFAMVLLSSLSIIIFISVRFIRIPLQNTINAFKTGAMGDFSVRLDVVSKDEFGRLAHYFNDFMKKLELYDRDLRNEILEHQQSEERLRKSEELYTKLVNTIPEIVVHTDLDGRILYANEVTMKLTGYSQESLIGKNILFFISSEDHDSAVHELKDISSAPQLQQEYTLVVRDEHTLNVEISGDVLRNEEGVAIGRVFVCHDVTQRKLAEKEREELQAQLIQAQKMESVGRLAGGVAHDFNNMLSVIVGSTELAMLKIEDTHPVYSILSEIFNAANRSADLTRQLLAFARKQTVKPEKLNLNETVSITINMLKRLIGEDIDLVWKPGDDLWQVYMDPAQVDQILTNLVVNARDVIHQDGIIMIETSNMVLDSTHSADCPGCPAGEYVMLSVSDNGTGMDKNTLKNIFEPFFTTKDKGRGTGLGLATVYGIVKQNNGFINVHSELGDGASFYVYLPRSLFDVNCTNVEKKKAVIKKGGGTILVVEDELLVMDVTKQILESLGYFVIAAENPSDAIHIAEKHDGQIDILMTDVVMPQMNGAELAEKIQKLRPNIKCLFTSGYTADVISHHGILDKNVYFIAKPFKMDAVSEKLQEIFNS